MIVKNRAPLGALFFVIILDRLHHSRVESCFGKFHSL